jgi:hypothetical protein
MIFTLFTKTVTFVLFPILIAWSNLIFSYLSSPLLSEWYSNIFLYVLTSSTILRTSLNISHVSVLILCPYRPYRILKFSPVQLLLPLYHMNVTSDCPYTTWTLPVTAPIPHVRYQWLPLYHMNVTSDCPSTTCTLPVTCVFLHFISWKYLSINPPISWNVYILFFKFFCGYTVLTLLNRPE